MTLVESAREHVSPHSNSGMLDLSTDGAFFAENTRSFRRPARFAGLRVLDLMNSPDPSHLDVPMIEEAPSAARAIVARRECRVDQVSSSATPGTYRDHKPESSRSFNQATGGLHLIVQGKQP
jgi:hypothetical protein